MGEQTKLYLSHDLFHLLKYSVNSKHIYALASLYNLDKTFPSIIPHTKWVKLVTI